MPSRWWTTFCVGEGENALARLLAALQTGKPPAGVVGLWGRGPGGEFRNPPVPLTDLAVFAQAYKQQIGLPFFIYARAESISEEKVRILKDMCCRTFAMGIESGNPRIRREVMNRHMSNQTIVKAFHLVAQYGIRTSAYNIIGLPRGDRVAIFDTIELNRAAAPTSFSVTMLEPYKGTPIRQLCEEQDLDPAYEVTSIMSGVHFVPRGMTQAQLQGLFRAFPLYVKMPKERWPEIERAESDDQVYQGLLAEYGRLK